MTDTFVVAWREPPSTRLRTFTNDDGAPLASPLDQINPLPAVVITDKGDLENWMRSETTQTAAISFDLARLELGWEPATPA